MAFAHMGATGKKPRQAFEHRRLFTPAIVPQGEFRIAHQFAGMTLQVGRDTAVQVGEQIGTIGITTVVNRRNVLARLLNAVEDQRKPGSRMLRRLNTNQRPMIFLNLQRLPDQP